LRESATTRRHRQCVPAIEMRRDKALNAERVSFPEPSRWLLDCFDFSEVADVRTVALVVVRHDVLDPDPHGFDGGADGEGRET
jgi:hypothetical protein